MRVRSKSRFSPRTRKRKNETESNSTAASEPVPKRMSKRIESEQKESASSVTRSLTVSTSVLVDKYCWLCHTEADDKICVTCHRAFHNNCVDDISASFSELGVCPECQSKSVDGTELSSNKFFNLDKLKRMLDVLARRSFDKKRKKNELFLRWPEEHRENLFKIIDFEILLDNINHVLPYTKTAEFYGDVKFIYHNSCITYGANSEQAKAAENLRRDFKSELLDLEACPECYYHLYCDESDIYDPFLRLCDSPHDIVWAQLKGHPYWPSKCLKVVKGIAHVRFFGEHEQSNIPINKCFFMSKSHPKNKNSNINNPENSGSKSQRFKSARTELLRYIHLYERKYGAFPFYPHKTPFKPQEKQNEVFISQEGNSNKNIAQMKLEGIVNEDSEVNVINASTVMEFSEDNLSFPTSVTNNITNQNEGQYTSLVELLSSVNVDPTLTATSVDGSSNNNSSPVTSINMSFSSDENPLNIENGSRNPVVTSIESLQTTEPAGGTSLDCERLLENIKGILNSEASNVAETLHCAEILSTTAASNAPEDSRFQPNSLHNIMNNYSVFTDNQTELDNEVHYIGQKRNTEAEEPFNPDIILTLLEENSDLKEAFKKARYVINGILVHLWANCSKNSDALGRISKLSIDLRKCRSDVKKLEEENGKIKKEEAENKYQIQSLTNHVKKLESEREELLARLDEEKANNIEARENAKTVIRSLKSGCSKKIEEMLKKQFMDSIMEKEKKLEDAEKLIKSFEEEKRQLEKDLEEAKVAKRNAEENLRVLNVVYDSDDIMKFKKTHYCCVCGLSAAFACCVNTSYCSQKCQEKHAEEHRPRCQREISSKIVQQTVCQQTLVVSSQTVSLKGRPTINNSSNSNSDTDLKASSQDPKPDISASSLPSTPHDRVMASSSRSSKSKRRYHR